jgi:hypothetical protein
MHALWRYFWGWYERNYILNVSIAFGLFILQIAHLFWLGGEVMATRLFGYPLFDFSGLSQTAILVVDYLEIPAIFTMTLVYVDAWRRGAKWNATLMLILLHSQWLHIFWITDEYIVDTFSANGQTVLPVWLAWTAILIDYLEVPVIIDTMKKLFVALRSRRGLAGVKEALAEE